MAEIREILLSKIKAYKKHEDESHRIITELRKNGYEIMADLLILHKYDKAENLARGK